MTGYIDVDEENIDESHETGLTDIGFQVLTRSMSMAGLDDVDFELEPNEPSEPRPSKSTKPKGN